MADPTSRAGSLIAGWHEWVALPDINLPAIKAKLDTGAKSSALHAETIQIVRVRGTDVVRFSIRPAARRPDLVVVCSAPLVDVRVVTSSNGRKEERPVIRSAITVGERVKTVEITLTDRGSMTYRMLIGRQALTSLGLLVDPAVSFQLPKLSFKLYSDWSRKR